MYIKNCHGVGFLHYRSSCAFSNLENVAVFVDRRARLIIILGLAVIITEDRPLFHGKNNREDRQFLI